MEVRKYTAQVRHVEGEDRPGPGWVKVTCPDFIGTDEVLPDWIRPLLDWGWFYVPDIDELIEIEVLYGTSRDDVQGQSAIYNPQIRWRGKRFYGGEETDAPRPVPDDFTGAHYGKLRGFATPNGHLILFDDTEDEPSVTIRWHRKVGETDKYASLSFDKDGKTKLTNQDGTEVHLDGGDAVVTCDKCNIKAATEITLGDQATLGVARLTDPVATAPGMLTWMTAVAAAINGLVGPGTIAPPVPLDFGKISGASTLAKAK